MSALDALLPREANNDYRGGRVPLYFFCLLIAMTTFRAFVHFLKDDSGVNSIATIVSFSGTPDPDQVIYMFSALWGSQQLIMVIVYFVVLLRYRSLVPLMWALMVVEVCFRAIVGTIHPLTEDYYLRTPPGKLGNLPLLLTSGLMLFLCLRNSRAGSSQVGARAPVTG